MGQNNLLNQLSNRFSDMLHKKDKNAGKLARQNSKLVEQEFEDFDESELRILNKLT